MLLRVFSSVLGIIDRGTCRTGGIMIEKVAGRDFVGQVPLRRGRGSDLSVSVVEQVAIRYSRCALARPLRASCLTGGDTIR